MTETAVADICRGTEVLTISLKPVGGVFLAKFPRKNNCPKTEALAEMGNEIILIGGDYRGCECV